MQVPVAFSPPFALVAVNPTPPLSFRMKIIVTGATGFVGRAVVNAALERGHTVIAVGGSKTPEIPGVAASHAFDLRDLAAIERLILDTFPEAIVNCAAVATIAGCDADPAGAEKLNVALPRHLAMLANHLGARFVHLSTDMVFDGEKGWYEHTDKPMPSHLYGQTKLLGEKEVLKFGKSHAVALRTTIVSGNSPSGDKGLHERMLRDWAARQDHAALHRGDPPACRSHEPRRRHRRTLRARQPLRRLPLGRFRGDFPVRNRQTYRRKTRPDAGKPHPRPVTYADVPDLGKRPRDLSFVLNPLQGKLRTKAQSFDRILESMTIPPDLGTWYAMASGRPVMRRLVKGVDF